ncbi:MAG: phosphatase PAP2 family protein [Methanosarcinaceae archaeon]|nr:phosphatase PAP2 family protein [Methanosarcinaceae archaeon]
MFQTEPILYLQALASDWLTPLMLAVSSMGSAAFFAAVIIGITFGIDFRRGFLLFQLLLWTGAVTEIFKVLFAFPRPYFADSHVLDLETGQSAGVQFTGPAFQDNGPKSFFSLPGREILEAFRARANSFAAYGFPSGHVSTTTALWGGAARIFENRNLGKLAPGVVVLMAFSRMYLGRHFLGDVIGGALLGLLLLLTFSRFLKSPRGEAFFRKESFFPIFGPPSPRVLFYFFMFVLPPGLAAAALIGPDVAGYLLGTNAAYLLVIRKGLPDDCGSFGKRAFRALIALLNFAMASGLVALGSYGLGAPGLSGTVILGPDLLEFTEAFLPAGTVWVSVEICSSLGLYGKEGSAGIISV